MEKFITSIDIQKVRHLQNIKIELALTERKHLILTGRNGSGKTSVLEALKVYLSTYISNDNSKIQSLERGIEMYSYQLRNLQDENILDKSDAISALELLQKSVREDNSQFYEGLSFYFNEGVDTDIFSDFKKGSFIVSYFAAKREFEAVIPKHVEKIELQTVYNINDKPRSNLVKYLLDLKTTEAFAERADKKEIANKISQWFDGFEKVLQDIFQDEKLKLDFDIETFEFNILQTGKEPFGFNQLSAGFAAVLDIVVDIILRMEKQKAKIYDIQGIVLIDELETHLHIKLQKHILPMLTRLFPRLQFIVTTHSPFILNSIDNAVVFDLEKQERIEDIYGYSYEGIVEYYFNEDMYSHEIKVKFDDYRRLINKANRTEEEGELLVDAITYLKQIPPMAARELVYEFRRMETERRGGSIGQN